MKSTIVALLLNAVSAEVLCGGHYAATCDDCPQGNGRSWCNGDCTWENNKCVLPTLMCTSEIPTYSCGDCPSGEQGCIGGDCVYNPSTKLCRDRLSNDVRTASVHLHYNAPISRPAWWFQRLQ